MPLLPTVAGVLAAGAVVSAVSTKQIALNFAGGSPSPRPTKITKSVRADGKHGRRTVRDGNRGPARGAHATPGAGGTGVSVVFAKTAKSATGFQGQVTITNHTRRTIHGWTLTFRFPEATILDIAGVLVIQKGGLSIIRNPASQPDIMPGQKVKVSFTASGSGLLPSTCTFNGKVCRP